MTYAWRRDFGIMTYNTISDEVTMPGGEKALLAGPILEPYRKFIGERF